MQGNYFRINMWEKFLSLIEQIAGGDKYAPPEVQLPSMPQPTQPITNPSWKPKIVAWGAEIKVREGGQPQNLNMINKNPGNIKASKYTRQLGLPGHQAIGVDSLNFLVFATLDDGMNALCQFLTECCEGEWLPYPKSESILSFTKTYAQPPNNEYAIACASAMGLSVDSPLTAVLT